MIKYTVGHMTTFVSIGLFPGGEVKVDINVGSMAPNYGVLELVVQASLKDSNDIMALLLTADALRRHFPRAEMDLSLPYVPYARQDRPCVNGEALSIAVMANLINSCGFSTVEVLDAHSDVTSALIKNCTNVPQSKIFNGVFETFHDFHIVAPDAGAYKKAHSLAQDLRAQGVICATKVRDVATGRIEGVNVTENVEGLNLLVADDLCDGGRTFTELATVLRQGNCKSLMLLVTHGLFTKGVGVLTAPGMYDKVYTTNSYHSRAKGFLDQDGKVNEKVRWVNVL